MDTLNACPQRSCPLGCDLHEAGQAGHFLAEGAACTEACRGYTLVHARDVGQTGGNEMRYMGTCACEGL